MIAASTLEALPELEDFAALADAKLARTDRPWVTLKAGASLDGRIATRHGESRWITSEESRHLSHLLRGAHDAVLCGIGTVLADDPALTVRHGPVATQPVRVVLDSTARIAPTAHCLRADGARRIVAVGHTAPPQRVQALEVLGVQIVRCASERPALGELLPALRAAGLHRVLVEGGGQIHGSFVASGEADALFLFIAGKILGDAEAPSWCAGVNLATLANASRLSLRPPRPVGPDVLLHALFQPGAQPDQDAP